RHRRLQGAGTDPAAAQGGRGDDGRHDPRRGRIHHPADHAGPVRAPRAHGPARPCRRSGDGPYRTGQVGRPGADRTCHRRPDRQGGARHGQRPGLDHAAGHRQEGVAGSGDEPSHVAAPGHPGQYRPAEGLRRLSRHGRVWRRPHGRAPGHPGRHRPSAGRTGWTPADRPDRRGDGRADVRADRPRARPDQPLQRQAGLCRRRRPGRTGGAGDADLRPGGAGRARGRDPRLGRGLGQDQEGAGRAAVAGPDRKPRHPGGRLRARPSPPETGGRFRRRDQRPGSQRARQALPQRVRLDRRQRRLGRGVRLGRKRRDPVHPQWRRALAAPVQDPGRQEAGPAHRRSLQGLRP
uniref:3-deoxy-7-phosphoheptulonate synthase n=1 Tax=Parastrongyloides trichosuri TaxID=131310 RepID=A0A0N4ZLB4_PARTI